MRHANEHGFECTRIGVGETVGDEAGQVERISFAQEFAHPPDSAYFPDLRRRHVYGLGIFFLMIAYWMLARGIGILPPIGGYVIGVFLLAAGVAYVLFRGRRARDLRRCESFSTLPQKTDDEIRLQVIGAPEEFEEFGSLIDVPFEPRWYSASFAVRRPRRIVMLQWLFGILICGLIIFVNLQLLSDVHAGDAYSFVLSAGVISSGLVALFNPISLRVTPGQLEVVSYSWNRERPSYVRSYDLKTSRVWIDLRGRRACVQDGDRKLGISLELLPRHREFAYMLLLGAISTHDTYSLQS